MSFSLSAFCLTDFHVKRIQALFKKKIKLSWKKLKINKLGWAIATDDGRARPVPDGQRVPMAWPAW